jgi:hypothetical protein
LLEAGLLAFSGSVPLAAAAMIGRRSILTRELAVRLTPMRWIGAIPLPLCGAQFERTLRDCLKNVRVHRRPMVHRNTNV